jgi:hypothetical protein
MSRNTWSLYQFFKSGLTQSLVCRYDFLHDVELIYKNSLQVQMLLNLFLRCHRLCGKISFGVCPWQVFSDLSYILGLE